MGAEDQEPAETVETALDIVDAADRAYRESGSQERHQEPSGVGKRTPDDQDPERSGHGKEALGSGAAPEIELPDGTKVTVQQLQEWRDAHATKQQHDQWQRERIEQETQLKIQREAVQRLLRDPTAYQKMRQEMGLGQEAKQDVVDPISQQNEWRYLRANMYRQLAAQKGQEIDERALTDQVERDLDRAVIRAQQSRIDEIQRSIQENQREAVEAKQAREIEQKLEPLYKRYPNAATEHGRRLVENELLRREYTGEQLNFEEVVKSIHDISSKMIDTYIKSKRDMAGRTRGVIRGGGTRDPGKTAIDKLPDDTSAFGEIANLISQGKLGGSRG